MPESKFSHNCGFSAVSSFTAGGLKVPQYARGYLHAVQETYFQAVLELFFQMINTPISLLSAELFLDNSSGGSRCFQLIQEWTFISFNEIF